MARIESQGGAIMTRIFIISFVCVIMAVGSFGCASSAGTAGAGAAGGFALSNMFAGAKEDISNQQAQLQAAYDAGVKSGADKAELDKLQQRITDLELAKQMVETGEGLFGVNWNDPKQAGAGIGSIFAVLWGWSNRKKLRFLTESLNDKAAAAAPDEGTAVRTVVKSSG